MSALLAEMWAWYGLTMAVVGARLLSRRLLFMSYKALQIDDWLILLTTIVYTALLIVIHVQTYTPTNLINPDDNIVLTPEDIKLREFGSKLVLVTEHLQMIVIWSVKACLLILYSRLMTSLKHRRVVTFVTWYVIAGFVIMEVLWFVWCRPFKNYWKVPAPELNCSAETNHMITNAVFNISSDIMIIGIPMPVLIGSQLPLKRKIILCCVFALGSFTVLAAILSKYYSLGSPYGTQWIYWYIREVSTAIIAANLPLTWTLLQRIFGMSNFYSRSRSTNRGTGEPSRQTRFRSTYGNLTSQTRSTKSRQPKDPHPIDISPAESQERITGEYGIPLKIWQRSEVQVTSEEVIGTPDHVSMSDKSDKSAAPGTAITTGEATSTDAIPYGNVEMGVVTEVRRET